MEKITFTILTASYKNGGLCVAGKDDNNKWVRIVTDDKESDGAISWDDWKASEACIGDQIEAECLEAGKKGQAADIIQPENVMVVGKSLRLVKKRTKEERKQLLDRFLQSEPTYDFVFGNVDDSLTKAAAEKMGHSLMLCKVQELCLYLVYYEYNGDFKHQFKADFVYNGQRYEKISLTDPTSRKKVQNWQLFLEDDDYYLYWSEGKLNVDGKYVHMYKVSDSDIAENKCVDFMKEHGFEETGTNIVFRNEAILAVSLGHPWGNNQQCYKFVANVFPL